MPSSRTPVDWLIVIVNVPAILLALAVGWMWIIDAAQHSDAADNRNRLGLAIGFIMAYLAFNSVIMIYLILRRTPPPTGTGERIKIRRSTLQAAIAQAQGETASPEPPASPLPFSRDAESSERSATEPTPPFSGEPQATAWSGEVPPIRRESAPATNDDSPTTV